ncbi:MAG: hypothetical protein EA344_01780 [Alkalicoccus sp.]|nr:MAG: hypothetical protein EA344_01780 [Alkalicoccus sp.]
MYRLENDHSFTMDNYQHLPTFSSFLPGIAGENGIPIWAFYVNRGQGIAGFGVKDKDHAVMEFFPADKAYQMVYSQGFRTFIKVNKEGADQFIEPFSIQSKYQKGVTEKMNVSENVLKLEHTNTVLGLTVQAEYFSLPELPAGGLVRFVKVTNTADDDQMIEMIDGLPAILPSGVKNMPYKELGNTLKSWFEVKKLKDNTACYMLRGSIEDSSEVKETKEGSYYWSTVFQGGEEYRPDPVVDRTVLFGSDTSLHYPEKFLGLSLEELTAEEQQTTNQVSSGFTPLQTSLEPGESVEVWSVMGAASSLEKIEELAASSFTREKLAAARTKALEITGELLSPADAATGSGVFDAYTRQSYLDNGLRGGFPKVFETGEKKSVFYLYSRKHGDLERDYNFFSTNPTYYSQGNGNYRDINQNRRMDVFFEPDVYDANVHQFISLIQLDGYNPLQVQGVRFKLLPEKMDEILSFFSKEDGKHVKKFLNESFTPGEVKHFLEERQSTFSQDFYSLLAVLLASSEQLYKAAYGEGYWIDHWTYNLDLIDNFLTVYPDHEEKLFFERDYPFYDSGMYIKPRKERYVLRNGKIRQYEAVTKSGNQKYDADSPWTRDKNGNVYETNLYSKLVLLAAVKTSAAAPYGLGLEMEADKPGWNDSLNGLPGMLGSGTSELMELYRLLLLLQNTEGNGKIRLPSEGAELIEGLTEEILRHKKNGETDPLMYWHHVNNHKENYRASVRDGVAGTEKVYSREEINEKIQQMLSIVKPAVETVKSYETIPPTYFYFQPEGNNLSEENLQMPDLKPNAVTPYLEGAVKALKTSGREEAGDLYLKVKQSNLFDEKLKMYKVSASIQGEPNEIGRAKSFTPGWLENESVFLHMEYKYLLEVLKAGLVDEFYKDAENILIPFMDPEVYGRSILEHSSFIASSAHPDPKVHGRGFVARLSGATVEFLNMWTWMMAGPSPFVMTDGKLAFRLSPVLADWLFKEDGTLSFMLFGHCLVTYSNKDRKATYGKNAAVPAVYELTYNDGRTYQIRDSLVTGEHAYAIRNKEVKGIRVTLE